MQIRYGYAIEIECEQATPTVLMLDIHPERRTDIVVPDTMTMTPLAGGASETAFEVYLDSFGNICRRAVVPAGGARFEATGELHDSGFTDAVEPTAPQLAPEDLPAEVLVFTLGSRYCETDALMAFAWERFGAIAPGWARVQAVCDFVHGHLNFDYLSARHSRSAAEALAERTGVCRDFAHLAITLCRCLNIPARYCTGYLGDIGVPPDPAPMDFSAWFEVWLGERWYTFDARHNRPRIGRILMARGRDATDVPFINSFGAHRLTGFTVLTEEIGEARFPATGAERRAHWQTLSAWRRQT